MTGDVFRFIGREKDINLLHDHWEKTLKGSGSVIILSGKSGIGKTRLLSEFIKGKENNYLVLRGTCFDQHAGSPLHPILIAFRDFAEVNSKKKDYKKMIKQTLPTMIKFIPVIGEGASGAISTFQEKKERQPTSALGISQEDKFFQILSILSTWSKKKPLLLIIEKLQYADSSTLTFITKLISSAPYNSYMVVCTYDSDESIENNNLTLCLHNLKIQNYSNIYELEPLENTTIKQSFSFNTKEAEILVDNIITRCGGNPYFISSLINYLVKDGSIEIRNNEFVIRKEVDISKIPDTIKSMVLRKIAQLSGAEKSLLDKCSILGETFLPEHAAELNKLDIIEALELLQKIEKSYKIIKECADFYKFDNKITHDVLYNELSGRLKLELHKKVVEMLESKDTRDPEIINMLAYHSRRGGLVEKSAEYQFLVGKSASKVGGDHEAIESLSSSLAATSNPRLKIETSLALSKANFSIGKIDESKRLLTDAKKIYDIIVANPPVANSSISSEDDYTKIQADILLHEGELEMHSSNYSGTKTCFQNALSIYNKTQDDDGICLTYSYLGRLAEDEKNYDTASEMYNKSLMIAERIGRKDMIASIYCDLGNLAMEKEDYNSAIELFQKALAISEELDNKQGIFADLSSIGTIYTEMGKYDEALAAFSRCLELDEESGSIFGIHGFYNNIARVYFEKGEYEKSIGFLMKNVQIQKELGRIELLMRSYKYMGMNYEAIKDQSRALEYYHLSISLAEKLKIEAGIEELKEKIKNLIQR